MEPHFGPHVPGKGSGGHSTIILTYDKDCQLGTILSNNIIGAFCMLFAWIAFFVIWNLIGLPVGPGTTVFMPAL